MDERAVLRHFMEGDGDLKSQHGAPEEPLTGPPGRDGTAPTVATISTAILEAGEALAWRAPYLSAAALAWVR